jgi:hypothetical protein
VPKWLIAVYGTNACTPGVVKSDGKERVRRKRDEKKRVWQSIWGSMVS